MTKAIYSVEKVDHAKKIIWLVDRDGLKSITNDAERVVEDVNSNYPGYRIVYRDTIGRWDEMFHTNGVFHDFGPASAP